MAIESPLKKEAERASKEIEALNRHYNIYFSGAEEDPPREKRRALDDVFLKLKQKVATSANASDKFFANSVIARYQLFVSKWDKQLKSIEEGKVIRPRGNGPKKTFK
jgi:hypothetical protein